MVEQAEIDRLKERYHRMMYVFGIFMGVFLSATIGLVIRDYLTTMIIGQVAIVIALALLLVAMRTKRQMMQYESSSLHRQ